MYEKLNDAVRALLKEALPSLFGGSQPAVKMTTTDTRFTLDLRSAEAVASEPRPDDRTDDLPFDKEKPAGPYTLTQPPTPGPRRVRLTTALKDRIPLRDDEVVWDAADARRFTLALRPGRDLRDVSGVQVLYSITAVYIRLKVLHTFSIELESNSAPKAQQAESLAVAVIGLNRQRLMEQGAYSFGDGDYGAEGAVKSLQLAGGASTPKKRTLNFSAEIELKATRALAEDEGQPIRHIRTEGRPLDPERPVDIYIDVEA